MRTARIPLSLAAFSVAHALLLAGCATGEVEPDEPSPTQVELAAPVVHQLDDSVKVGGVTVSDMEIVTEGCEFTTAPTRDAVKFQLMATVENNTDETIAQVLWPTEVTFVDPEGFSVSPLDIASGEGPCANDQPSEFINMTPGQKRRAAVTLEAPVGATSMVYSTSLIKDAEPVTWDIADHVAELAVVTPAGFAEQKAAQASSVPEPVAQPSVVQQAPIPAPRQASPPIGITEAPGVAAPAPLVGKQVQRCMSDSMYQQGTTLFTDGTTGWTEQCAYGG